jgi:hypothetical protein
LQAFGCQEMGRRANFQLSIDRGAVYRNLMHPKCVQ